MIPELGYGAVVVGVLLALYGATAAAVGARTGRTALIESAQHRWRAVNSAHLVALVRAGAKFEHGVLVERPDESTSGDTHAA